MTPHSIKIKERNPADLRPYEKNARVHSKAQITQIAGSITRFGFNVPVLVDREDRIIAGHGRIEAAKKLGLAKVPTILIEHLSEAERRAFLIADTQSNPPSSTPESEGDAPRIYAKRGREVPSRDDLLREIL